MLGYAPTRLIGAAQQFGSRGYMLGYFDLRVYNTRERLEDLPLLANCES